MSRLSIGEKITIKSSKKLTQSGHGLLVNRFGTITKIVYGDGGKLLGVQVDIQVTKKTRNYYIPVDSIDGIDSIDKMRTYDILKTMML